MRVGDGFLKLGLRGWVSETLKDVGACLVSAIIRVACGIFYSRRHKPHLLTFSNTTGSGNFVEMLKMKEFVSVKKLLWLLLTFLLSVVPKAQPLVDVAVFYNSRLEPYLECRLWIPRSWLTEEKVSDRTLGRKADVAWIFFKDGRVYSYDRYFLKDEGEDTDTAAAVLDLKRYALPPGAYAVELVVTDVYSKKPDARFTWQDSVWVQPADPKGCTFSHLDFLADVRKTSPEDSMARNGLLMTPQFHELFDDNNKILTFYTELYGARFALGEASKLLLRARIKEFATDRYVRNLGMQEVKEAADLIPWLGRLNVATLPAGHYVLEVEALGRNGERLARVARYFEHRGSAASSLEELLESAPLLFMENVNNPDTLVEYIRCLRPIASPAEARIANNVLKSGDYQLMKRFVAAFWQNRNPEDPEAAFLEYRSRVTQAQIAFGRCKMRVYDTDRGRVFLQYGPPNHRAERPMEPNAWPYEIWQYYDLPNQKNRIFVFYDYIGGCNTYELLHSTALSERRNDQWQNWLQRGRRPIDIQATQTPAQSYGSMANDLFINPR